MRGRWTVLLLAILLLVLCACADGASEMQYDGRELTEEEIAAMLARSTEEEVREVSYTLVPFDEAYTASDGQVFWTASGSVFHADAFCHHLSKAKEVYYGTAEDAASCKKERACTACGIQENE